MAAILNSAFWNHGFNHFAQKKTSLIYSDSTWWWQPSWISAMLDSDTAILDSDILLSFLRFTQKYSHSTLTLTQTNSIWLKLIHSDFTWWWHSAILDSAILHKTLTQTSSIWLKLIHSHSTWWWQPSWTLPSWIQPFCTKKKLHSFILTQLDDGSHLEVCHVGFRHCHLGFRHLVIFSQIHSKTLSLHSDSDSN